ncbi:adhesion G protein-coupled receptor E5 isoform X2 [Engraulis encrasicolus]|uniref:adhesion G protein-coupled receptor E5 isoform X2 n=1 Tax=Engraulis encrasicolus TaxID=184585 RepID=UPI002FD44874
MRYRGHLLVWELQLLLLVFVVESEVCREGFIVDRSGTCVEFDECNTVSNPDYPEFEDPPICGDNADCFNTVGSYNCQCKAGFRPSRGNNNFTAESGVKCQEINTCSEKKINCGANAKCENSQGSYVCVCKEGFLPNNDPSIETFLTDQGVTCQDIDDCIPGPGQVDCGSHAKCENKIGGHTCICDDGFETSSGQQAFTDAQSSCQDIDECNRNPTICNTNSQCINNLGSYKCTCNPGYTVNDTTKLCEEDVCKLRPSICGGGVCHQGNSGHECLCHEGYAHSGSNQEGCTALNCSMFLGDVNHWQSFGPELDAVRNLLSSQCVKSAEGKALGQTEELDAEALLMKLLSLIDDLLSKGPLSSSEQVNVLLSTVEQALKLLGPLLKNARTKKSSIYAEVELHLERGSAPPAGVVSLSSESGQLDTHWDTVAGDAFPGFASVVLLTYKNLEKSTNSYFSNVASEANQRFQMDSKVVTAAVSNKDTAQLKKNVTLTFHHLTSGEVQRRCVYWDHGNSVWSERGCTMVMSDANHSICSCSHLSSFAVLMALYEVEDTIELLLITWVGLSLSLVCLLACVLTFALCRSIHSTRTTIHLHLSLSLFIASLIFLAGISRTENQVGCAVVAGLLHFFYLAAFCWMLLEGVQLFRMVVLVFHTTLRPLYMVATGYGVPAAVVALSAIFNAKGYGSKRLCWFDVTRDAFIWSFLGPVCLIIAVSVFFFLITVYKLAEKFSSLNPDLNNLRKIKTFTITAVAQLTVLGTMWIFGCFQFNKNTMAMSYIFTILNCLQGVMMFLMHCLLNKQVREEYGKLLSCICAPHKSKYSDFTSSNQSKSQLSKSAQNTGESHI